ncbi:MAG: site-specific integrase [Paludibacteraceae bacterium]|nr:site-specific integrase [Paludibacteraceae bacterium]
MHPTIRILFDRKKQATDTVPGLIQIEVYYKARKKYISTGIKVLPQEWDEANKQIKGSKNDFNSNYLIGNLRKKIEEHIIDQERNNEEFSFTTLDAALTGNVHGNLSFQTYFLERLDKRKIKDSTEKKLMTLYNHVDKFGRLKSFSDLTQQNIKAFDDFLYAQGLSKTSIYERHKQLKSFINEAIADGFIKQSPYIGLKIQRGKPETRKYLTEDEVSAIEAAEIDVKHIARARDLFVFCCYTGLAYADLFKFDFKKVVEQGGDYFIEDTRQKTDEPFHILILPKAYEVLKLYDFVLPKISNQKYNDYLKVVGALAGIKKNLTTHMARHTFATTVLLDHDVPLEVVQKLLGHSSIRTTQIYAKLSQKVANQHMKRLKGIL